MKHLLSILPVLAFVLFFQDIQAQSIRSMIRNKIIEDALETEAKKDSIEAVEAGEEPDPSPNTTMNQVYLDAFGLSGNVDYESTYTFDAYIKMEVSEFKKNEQLKEKVIYNSYYTKDAINYAMVFQDKRDKSTIIFDSKNSAMLMLTDSDGEKTGIAIGIDPETMAEQTEEYDDELETDPYKTNKTGRTKTILGYSCDEYLVEDENSEARMWVSEKLGKQVRREMLNNKQTFGGAFYYAAYVNGMVMEYDLQDKEDGERTVMLVTDINLNQSHSISTRSYAVMTMDSQPAEE